MILNEPVQFIEEWNHRMTGLENTYDAAVSENLRNVIRFFGGSCRTIESLFRVSHGNYF